MDLDDVKIADSIAQSNREIIDDTMTKMVNEIMIKQERLLLLALKKGYDGVDIKLDSGLASAPSEFSIGFEYETWKGEPRSIEPFERNIRRYDFRMLTEEEKEKAIEKVERMDLETKGLSL